MTPKSPEEQAEELYPKLEEDYPIYLSEVVEMERAAWLSRQAEVDELKRQVEELKENNRQSIELAIKATDDKTFYVDEIRKLLNLYGREEISLSRFAEILNIKAMAIRNVKPVHDNYDKLQAQIAAKEKEVDELKRQVEECDERVKRAHDAGFVECSRIMQSQLAAKEKGHDAEMCAFAEWMQKQSWKHDFREQKTHTTTELLKQFRDEKH
jgi:cell division protein FtsB